METLKDLKLISKAIGSHPYIKFNEDEIGGTFYQENLDNAVQIFNDGQVKQFSKRFFELCKIIAQENGTTVYFTENPTITGINGLANWEDGFDHELYDLWHEVIGYSGNWDMTFVVCDDEGYCIKKYGNTTSRTSKLLQFV